MQYRDGSVSVINGSDVVIGNGTRWLSNVSIGDIFLVFGVQETYLIASIISDTEIVIDRDYSGDTAASISYAIARSFTPIKRYPYPEKSDVEVASILERTLKMVDQETRLSFQIVGEDEESIYLDDNA